MQSLSLLLLSTFSLLSWSFVDAATLPSSIVLLIPPDPTYANEKWSYGVDDSSLKTYGGYLRTVNFSLTLPNGTTQNAGATLTVNVTYGVGANGTCVPPFNYTSEIITDTFT
ncbi:ras-domain-containing protein [Pseudohyphozyma bogoriensis]|nr:ras-domain-containing protein [Pseudohyphozyma bogoriensis]